jgi:hypothetical protein
MQEEFPTAQQSKRRADSVHHEPLSDAEKADIKHEINAAVLKGQYKTTVYLPKKFRENALVLLRGHGYRVSPIDEGERVKLEISWSATTISTDPY